MSIDETTSVYRSKMAMITGVLLLAVGVWLVVDTVVRGSGDVVWKALSALVAGGALVFALTLRAAVAAGPKELLIRNPFRTITIPWAAVEHVKAEYSVEVVTEGKSFHIWAIPVSLRERKRASRLNSRALGDETQGSGYQQEPKRAVADNAVEDLRGMAEQFAKTSTGPVTVRWALEVLIPLVAGAVALVVALAV
jgi:hypothetical protein